MADPKNEKPKKEPSKNETSKRKPSKKDEPRDENGPEAWSQTGQLAWFIGDLYNPKPGGLRARLRKEPLEDVFDEYDLTQHQRRLVCTYDRERIAEALYWDIALTSPYSERGMRVLWPNPRRAITSEDETILVSSSAHHTVETAGIRDARDKYFSLTSIASGLEIRAQFVELDSGSTIKQQKWTMDFDTSGMQPGTLLRLRVNDGSGVVTAPTSIEVVAAIPPSGGAKGGRKK